MNRVLISGYLTNDVKTFVTRNGHTKVDFILAAKRPGKTTGTDFIPCTAWGVQAETLSKYFGKGKGIEIEGKVTTANLKDGEDKTFRYISITVDRFEFPKLSRLEATAVKNADEVGNPIPDFGAFVNIPEGEDDEAPFA